MSNPSQQEWIEEFDRLVKNRSFDELESLISHQISASYEAGMTAALAAYNQRWYEKGREEGRKSNVPPDAFEAIRQEAYERGREEVIQDARSWVGDIKKLCEEERTRARMHKDAIDIEKIIAKCDSVLSALNPPKHE